MWEPEEWGKWWNDHKNELEKHPTKSVDFDWKSLLGTPPMQKPVQIFSYKHAGENRTCCKGLWDEKGRTEDFCQGEIYFAKERQDYIKATEKGAIDPRARNRAMWDLLSGKEEEGYSRLEECVESASDYMKDCLKEPDTKMTYGMFDAFFKKEMYNECKIVKSRRR